MENHMTIPKSHLFLLSNIQEILEKMNRASRIKDDNRKQEKYNFTEERLNKILNDCLNSKYRFLPYEIKLILKGRGKPPREICMPLIQDKLVLKLTNLELNANYPLENQTHLAAHIINDFTNNLEAIESTELESFKVMRLDIKNFFDRIDHDILLRKVIGKGITGFLLHLIESSIKNSSKEGNNKALPRNEGVPQGISIASYLADLYLAEFDEELKEYCNFSYRYVDDIIIVYKKQGEEELKKFIKNKLDSLKLETHLIGNKPTEKSFDGDLYNEEGFDFLGYNIRRRKEYVLISIRESSQQKFINSIINFCTKHKRDVYHRMYQPAELADMVFAFDINEKITGAFRDNKRYGWLWYFSQLNDLSLLDKIDNIVDKQLSTLKLSSELQVKRLKRAYYEIKYFNEDNAYILNYGLTDPETIKKRYGFIDEDIEKAEGREDVLKAFNLFVNRRLKKLELDQMHHS